MIALKSNIHFNIYSKDEIPFFDMLKKIDDKISVDGVDYDVYVGITDDLDDLVNIFLELQYLDFNYEEYLNNKFKDIDLDNCNMSKEEIFKRIDALKKLMMFAEKTKDEAFEIADEFLKLTDPKSYKSKHEELEQLKTIYNQYEKINFEKNKISI